MNKVRWFAWLGCQISKSLSTPTRVTLIYPCIHRSFLCTTTGLLGQVMPDSLFMHDVGRAYRYSSSSSHAIASLVEEPILVRAKDPSQLALEIENALEEQRYEDAWQSYEWYKQMHGFPRKSVLNKLITGLAEKQEQHWLEKSYDLVMLVIDENKFNLLEKDTLIFLSYNLARAGLAIPASTILRKMVDMEEFPPVNAWSAILAHIALSASGTSLATEMMLEIGHHFKDNRVDPRKKSNSELLAMKPNTLAFNICLCGCLLHGLTRKAELLLEMMPFIGVKADVTLLIIMAHICEKNGRIDEIKKLKRHIDESCHVGGIQYQQFYNCLLTCHLNFGDLMSASQLVLELLRKAKEARSSLREALSMVEGIGSKNQECLVQTARNDSADEISLSSTHQNLLETNVPTFLEFSKDGKFFRLHAEAKALLLLLLDQISNRVSLVGSQDGILYPTEKVYAKLVKAFLEVGKVLDLAQFLILADKEETPVSVENTTCVQVIHACISLGKLDEAHDLLDEMRMAGVRTSSSVYSALLKAYCRTRGIKEITSLLNDARKCGIQLDANCYEALINARVSHQDIHGAIDLFKEMKDARISSRVHDGFDSLIKECEAGVKSNLMVELLEEIKDGEKGHIGVHDWNNVIHFFCKKQLMQDARKALKKMKSLGHIPNAQTYHSLVTGYSSIGGKYQEIAELWGEIKMLSSSSSSAIRFDQELLDSVLYNFVRGGFFQRANEAVQEMERGGMFIDKFKYRQLFLKYHRTLYKNKKALKFQTESRFKKREEALVFKSWVGLT